MAPPILLRMRRHCAALKGKYQVVADFMLAHPERIVGLKVKDVAQACGCDESAVVRCCQKLGFAGHAALKRAVIAELLPSAIRGAAKASSGRRPEDDFARWREQFLDGNRRALCDTVALLSRQEVDAAVKIVRRARRVHLLGAGASGLVAQDAQMKLLRQGINAVFQADAEFGRLLLAMSGRGDAVMAFSFGGETASVCAAVAAAKERGLAVVAITNVATSPLARQADVVLLTAADESRFRLGAMTSRLAQCVVLDFLVMALALRAAAPDRQRSAGTKVGKGQRST